MICYNQPVLLQPDFVYDNNNNNNNNKHKVVTSDALNNNNKQIVHCLLNIGDRDRLHRGRARVHYK